MNPKQNESQRKDEDTIEDVTGDEAEKVAGGGLSRNSGIDDPNDNPPDGQLTTI